MKQIGNLAIVCARRKDVTLRIGSRHNGMDIDGVNSFVIRMPSFNGKTISGTVTRSRIVTDHSDSTWEWGYYVTVKLSTPQTVD